MRTARRIKVYNYVDKSGRGFTEQFTRVETQRAFKGERNYDGQALSSWALTAQEGDVWENASSSVTIIGKYVTR